ncbi:MAG: hypothetical protein CL678_03885 [Bdellovibrionaceae bacterium]|nr:hypothetical protein [Pseudobdellovibrionaceae bacterium]|tara:strand:- start:2066 stop:2845 length:780 start_codon:yes stop_codon:yes gene_type:complete
MAENKGQVVIIKKIQGGHGGAHGGAWKVAYADFVTAMMAFFLVMWLLGADDASEKSVSEYFNNPTSAWRPDLASKENYPLGEKTGAGENVLSGVEDGKVPEDLVQRPSREIQSTNQPPGRTGSTKVIEKTIKDRAPSVNVEFLVFSLPEHVLFDTDSFELKPQAGVHLEKVAQLIRGHQGYLKVRGFTHPPDGVYGQHIDSYELAVTRITTIIQYLVEKGWVDENRVMTDVSDPIDRGVASESQNNHKFEFMVMKNSQQ